MKPAVIKNIKNEAFKISCYANRLYKNEKVKVWKIDKFTYGKRANKPDFCSGLKFLSALPEERKSRKVPGVPWELWSDRFPAPKLLDEDK